MLLLVPLLKKGGAWKEMTEVFVLNIQRHQSEVVCKKGVLKNCS